MGVGGWIVAIAIEDTVDLLVRDAAGDDAHDYEFSKAIPEGPNYLEQVHELLVEALKQLARKLAPEARAGRVRDLFNSIDAICVSVPGVVAENRSLIQKPTWKSESREPARWQHQDDPKEAFEFDKIFADIAARLIVDDNDIWGGRECRRFMNRVFVVNDTSACAAYEYHLRRTNLQNLQLNKIADYAYMKLHNGMNIAVLEFSNRDNAELRINDAEAGHTFPLIHKLDFDAGFMGVCGHHRSCYEGMVAGHSFYERASKAKKTHPFAAWKVELDKFKKQGLRGMALDNALVRYVLGDRDGRSDGVKEGIDILSHYAAQAALHMSIGPLSVGQLVVGGQMATPGVIEAMRNKVVAWSQGYPKRPSLTEDGIKGHIVPCLEGMRRRVTVEAVGAQVIAFSRANLPLDNLVKPASTSNLNMMPVPQPVTTERL